MHTHPEQTRDEIFVGNTDSPAMPSHLRCLTKSRLGRIAYTLDGKQAVLGMRPVLIHKEDHARYDRIMCGRFSAACRGT